MNCQQCRSRIEAYELSVLDPSQDAALERHITACPECRSVFEIAARDGDGIRRFADRLAAERGARISASVLALSRLESHPTPTKVVRIPHLNGRWGWYAAAASVLAVLTVGRFVRTGTPEAASHSTPFSVLWSHGGMEGTFSFSPSYPIVQGERLLAFQSHGGELSLVSYSRETGALEWSVPQAAPKALVADNSHVYVVEAVPDGHRLLALDFEHGVPAWVHDAKALPRASRLHQLVAVNGILVWAGNERILGLARRDGTVQWEIRIDDPSIRALAAGDEGLFFAASDEKLRAVCARSGNVAWERAHDSRAGAALHIAVDGPSVVVARSDGLGRGRLTALDASTGQESWTKGIGFPANVEMREGRIFLTAQGLNVFSSETGDLLWTANIPGCGPAFEAEGIVYLVGGRHEPAVFAYDAKRGEPLWKEPLTGSGSGLVLRGNRGYVSGLDGSLYAVTLPDRSS